MYICYRGSLKYGNSIGIYGCEYQLNCDHIITNPVFNNLFKTTPNKTILIDYTEKNHVQRSDAKFSFTSLSSKWCHILSKIIPILHHLRNDKKSPVLQFGSSIHKKKKTGKKHKQYIARPVFFQTPAYQWFMSCHLQAKSRIFQTIQWRSSWNSIVFILAPCFSVSDN